MLWEKKGQQEERDCMGGRVAFLCRGVGEAYLKIDI